MSIGPLEPGECHVWWARPGDAGERAHALVDPDERRRLARLRRRADRDRFVAARGLTRLVLAGYLDRPAAMVAISRRCPACGEPHGKPRLASPGEGLEFSVSHSGDRVVVAVSRRPVGVDVEQLRAELLVEELAPQVLLPGEAAALRDLRDRERTTGFLVYWTRKEAMVKATGQGLAMPLSSVGVSGPGEPPRLTAWPARSELAGQVSLHDLDAGAGHVAALAVIGGCGRVLERDGSVLLRGGSSRDPMRGGDL
jgi:4'-phosphopantetheinyl transferase